MNEIEKKLEKYFMELPPSFQSAIKETAWQGMVRGIGIKNKLDEIQVESLLTETIMVLYGVEDVQEYTANLVRELNVDESIATTMASEITETVFEPLQNKAKENKDANDNLAPIIITQATKQEALERLKLARIEKQNSPSLKIIAVAKPNLPMIEEGEVAHEVPHVEVVREEVVTPLDPVAVPEVTKDLEAPAEVLTIQPAAAPEKVEPSTSPITPIEPVKQHYEQGKDPYREPLV